MIKYFFHQTTAKKIIGIVITPAAEIPGTAGREIYPPRAAKYRYIDNSQFGISTFCNFAKRKFPGATHINFYDPKKAGKDAFIERIYLT